MKQPSLTIVVPCYNEEEVFPTTLRQLKNTVTRLIKEGYVDRNSKILFVDDGSRDSTWDLIKKAYTEDSMVNGLKLSRNFGHQRALMAGLEEASRYSDCVISIDADLQDDISVIKEFVIKYLEGYDVVYGVRKRRETDSFFKRTTAQMFYRLMEKMGLPLVYNHADYRLLSRRALNALLQYKEANLFLRGIVPLLGFKSAKVYYDRKERAAGESKYPLPKMLALALDGITSFSVKPIRLITAIGFISSLISFLAAVYVLVQKFSADPVGGWASIMISLWFIGGLLLISIGLIGEYVGKIYEEVKGRPRYILEERLQHFSQEYKRSKQQVGK